MIIKVLISSCVLNSEPYTFIEYGVLIDWLFFQHEYKIRMFYYKNCLGSQFLISPSVYLCLLSLQGVEPIWLEKGLFWWETNKMAEKNILCYCRCFIETVCFNTIAFRQLDYQLWQCVFVLWHRFALEKAIDIKPTGETRYVLSWVHKRTISVHFTDIMLGFSCHICSLLYFN